MSKELERVKEKIISLLNDNFEDDIYGTNHRILNLKLENVNLQMQIEQLMQPAIQKKLLEPMPSMFIKQLPPSTQEEVCEALSAYFKKEVKIDKRYKDIVFTCDNRNIVMVDNNSIRISQWLPPKLGKMIFAFYEGLEATK